MNQTTYRLLEGQKDVKKKMGSLLSLVLQGVGAAMGGADQVLSSSGDGFGTTAAGTIADSATAIGDSLDLEGGSGIAGGIGDAGGGLSAPLTNVGPGGGQLTSGFNSPRMSMKSPAGNALIQVGRGFGKGLGLGGSGGFDGGVNAFNQKVALGDYEAQRDAGYKKSFFDYEQQKKQEDQIADEARGREEFKFQNAEKLKAEATSVFIKTTGVTPEQRPDLYNKFVSEFANQAYNTSLAQSKASEAEGIFKAHDFPRQDAASEVLTPLKTKYEAGRLGGLIGNQLLQNRADEARLIGEPAKVATDIFQNSTKPFMGGSLSLDINSGDTTRFSPPDEKSNLTRILAGQQPLGETASAFGGGAPITLSNGMTVPAKPKPGGILSRVLGNDNTKLGLSGANRPINFSSDPSFAVPTGKLAPAESPVRAPENTAIIPTIGRGLKTGIVEPITTEAEKFNREAWTPFKKQGVNAWDAIIRTLIDSSRTNSYPNY